MEGLLDRWELRAVADQPVAELSRGWRQRYGLARLDHGAVVLRILDEPTTGLDTAGRHLLDAAISRWRETGITLVTSHDDTWLEATCTSVLDITAGARS